MERITSKSIALALLTGLMLPTLTNQSVADAEDRIQKNFTVDVGGTLIVDVDRGSIDVTTVPGNELKVEVVRKANSWTRRRGEDALKGHKVEISEQGNNVRIYSRYKGQREIFSSWRRPNLNVRYLISTPKRYDGDLRTAGGSISVSDLDGEVKARTSGGSLKFGRIDGRVWGRTSGGSITLQSCKQSADVETSGGSLRIGQVEGPVSAKTSGGSIEINQVRGDLLARTSGGSIRVNEVFGKIDASTSGGSVSARLSSQPSGDCTLRTSGGSIEVRLAEKIAVNLDASTSGGRVITEIPVTIHGELRKNALKSRINGGGPILLLHTSGGNVRIRRL